MFYLPALFHGLALGISLCVQYLSSPIAGMWFFFYLAGIGVLLRNGYSAQKGLVWYASLFWLIALAISAFFIITTGNASAVMFTLAAAPLLAICMKQEYLKSYLWAFGSVITLYALNLCAQWALGAQYTVTSTEDGFAWPLLDPNNAAAVLNIGLLPAFYLALRNKKWWILVAILAFALNITHSRGGFLAACACCFILILDRYRHFAAFILMTALSSVYAVLELCPGYYNSAVNSLSQRLPIWDASLSLVMARPFTGLGLGSFQFYYAQVRTETTSGGWFAHNDLLQIAVEAGIPALAVFAFLIAAVAVKTNRHNIVAACVMLAVFLQAMIEFQFYVPSVSILMGLALAYHTKNNWRYI